MAIERWDPLRATHLLQRSINRMFDDTYPGGGENFPAAASFMFPVDIKEDPEQVVVKAEIPGLKSEEIKVNLHENHLTIRGERKRERKENGERFIRTERSYGSFFRAFDLGVAVKADQIKSDYKDGVLEIVLPKGEKVKPKERRIDTHGSLPHSGQPAGG